MLIIQMNKQFLKYVVVEFLELHITLFEPNKSWMHSVWYCFFFIICCNYVVDVRQMFYAVNIFTNVAGNTSLVYVKKKITKNTHK